MKKILVILITLSILISLVIGANAENFEANGTESIDVL